MMSSGIAAQPATSSMRAEDAQSQASLATLIIKLPSQPLQPLLRTIPLWPLKR
jgi:hypothetical protein